MITLRKGELAQLKVELRALEKGYIVSRPSSTCRYDLVIDDGDRLWRVQVKYADGKASNTENSVIVSLGSADRAGNENPYLTDQVDALAVYLPMVDRVLWFPPEKFCGRMKLQIRMTGLPRINSVWFENYLW